MNFVEAIKSGFQNYVNFSGRAIRSEYWFWTLFAVLVSIATSLLDYLIFPDMDCFLRSTASPALRCFCPVSRCRSGGCMILIVPGGGC